MIARNTREENGIPHFFKEKKTHIVVPIYFFSQTTDLWCAMKLKKKTSYKIIIYWQ